jgi:hypothetical protein
VGLIVSSIFVLAGVAGGSLSDVGVGLVLVLLFGFCWWFGMRLRATTGSHSGRPPGLDD